MLYAQRKQVFKEYHNIVFERFWKRELDIEDPTVIAAVLSEAGANVSGFEVFLAGEGVAELEHIMDDAHERGVFGVPSFIIDHGSSIGVRKTCRLFANIWPIDPVRSLFAWAC